MKRLVFACCAIGLMLLCGSVAQAGLLHYWDFEDVTGGGNTPAVDQGSSPVPLTPGSTWTVVQPGHDGNKDVKVNRYDSATANGLMSFGSSFTMETWYRYDGSGSNGWNRIMNGWAASPLSLHLGNSLYAITIDGNAVVQNGAWANPAVGTWCFLAVVANAGTNTVKGYAMREAVDGGVLQTVVTGAYNGNSTSGTPFRLNDGSKYSGYNVFDWVAVWDTALDEATITSHMTGGITIPEPSTLALLGVLGAAGLLACARRRAA